jgi:hypothetical protein
MSHRIVLLSVVAPFLFVASHAKAADETGKSSQPSSQENFVSFRGHPFSLFMLHNKLVQEELRLSALQKDETTRLIKAYGLGSRDDLRRMAQLTTLVQSDPKSPQKKALSDLCETLNRRSDHYEGLSLRSLDAARRERLQQLQKRSLGIRLFFDPQISEKLGITPSQKEEIVKFESDCNRKCVEVGKLVRSRKLDGSQATKEVFALRREANEFAVLALKPTQLETLKSLLGPTPSFDASQLVLREVIDR